MTARLKACGTKLPLFCVQYHPEAGPGPHDAGYLFGRFTALMKEFKKEKKILIVSGDRQQGVGFRETVPWTLYPEP